MAGEAQRTTCACCNAYLHISEWAGLDLGQTGILPCGCAYCWHCDDNRGRAEDHDPDCKGPNAADPASSAEMEGD